MFFAKIDNNFWLCNIFSFHFFLLAGTRSLFMITAKSFCIMSNYCVDLVLWNKIRTNGRIAITCKKCYAITCNCITCKLKKSNLVMLNCWTKILFFKVFPINFLESFTKSIWVYSYGQSISRLFHILGQFMFTISER